MREKDSKQRKIMRKIFESESETLEIEVRLYGPSQDEIRKAVFQNTGELKLDQIIFQLSLFNVYFNVKNANAVKLKSRV